jgi:hypothetical protein
MARNDTWILVALVFFMVAGPAFAASSLVPLQMGTHYELMGPDESGAVWMVLVGADGVVIATSDDLLRLQDRNYRNERPVRESYWISTDELRFRDFRFDEESEFCNPDNLPSVALPSQHESVVAEVSVVKGVDYADPYLPVVEELASIPVPMLVPVPVPVSGTNPAPPALLLAGLGAGLLGWLCRRNILH